MRGGKLLNNWRMAQLHAQEAPDRVLELEEWGALFDRTKDGLILQRDFGGHRYARLAHVGDRTGLEMIRTLQNHAVASGKRILVVTANISLQEQLVRKDLPALRAALPWPFTFSLVKGRGNPRDYFDLFRNSALVQKDSHAWFRNKVVTLFDDHDQVRKGSWKARFFARCRRIRRASGRWRSWGVRSTYPRRRLLEVQTLDDMASRGVQ